jgi:hypothetical protein
MVVSKAPFRTPALETNPITVAAALPAGSPTSAVASRVAPGLARTS